MYKNNSFNFGNLRGNNNNNELSKIMENDENMYMNNTYNNEIYYNDLQNSQS